MTIQNIILHSEISSWYLHSKIRQKQILFGGNKKLKIYGRLNCASGKKMKRGNRVFFATEEDALQKNYRPCGHCMKPAYKAWKNNVEAL